MITVDRRALARELIAALNDDPQLRGELASALRASSTSKTEQLVTVAEYATARSIATSTVRAAIREGRLPAIKIGRAVRVAVSAEIGKPVAAARSKADTPASRADRILGIAGGRR